MCFPVRKRTCESSMLNEELRISDESNKTCAEEPLKYLNFYGLFNKLNHFKSLQTSKAIFGFQKLIPIYIVKDCLLQFNFLLSPFLNTLCQIRPKNFLPNTLF